MAEVLPPPPLLLLLRQNHECHAGLDGCDPGTYGAVRVMSACRVELLCRLGICR